jgi:hypothetical protein
MSFEHGSNANEEPENINKKEVSQEKEISPEKAVEAIKKIQEVVAKLEEETAEAAKGYTTALDHSSEEEVYFKHKRAKRHAWVSIKKILEELKEEELEDN